MVLAVICVAALVYPLGAVAFSFDRHWEMPIPLQGEPPKDFSDLESSLDPASCGECHDVQYSQWKQSRHATSMGPGVVGQLGEPWLDKETIEMCLDCHAPLGEQRLFSVGAKGGKFTKNPFLQKDLHKKGLVCAVCHLRKNVRYGPPALKPSGIKDPPHGGFVAVESFNSSDLCRSCHQFESWGRRINGKLLEDTFNQWKKSRYSKEGVQCANCHMKGRAHSWKGIHDKEMVASGVDISAKRDGAVVTVAIKNVGVGHFFPTYVTPQVVVELVAGGKVLSSQNVGWMVPLDLSEEIYDTRIPPGETWERLFAIPRDVSADVVSVIIRVYPDDFYHRFYESLLSHPPDGINLALIKKAHEESGASSYLLYEKTLGL